jgi:hypothetical protein
LRHNLLVTFMSDVLSHIHYAFSVITLFTLDSSLTKQINTLADEQANSNILTYIKFRSDDPKVYNARFRVKVNGNEAAAKATPYQPPRYLTVEYNDDDEVYYKKIDKDNEDKCTNLLNINDNLRSQPDRDKAQPKQATQRRKIAQQQTQATPRRNIPPRRITGGFLEHTKCYYQTANNRTYEIVYNPPNWLECSLSNYPDAENPFKFQGVSTPDFTTVRENNINLYGNLIFRKYEREYLMGPFTRIYTPRDTNAQIANTMTPIINKLRNGDPVFMMGYGASGAGKTSTLIYFSKADVNNKDGILLHLCKIMGKGTNLEPGLGTTPHIEEYPTLELWVYEFYHSPNHAAAVGPKPKQIRTPLDNKKLKFTMDNTGSYKIDATAELPSIHPYRMGKDNVRFEENKSSLGEVIIHLVDTDRLVKATTNNPNSSRSHVLVFIQFQGAQSNATNKKRPLLIIGDFAGVENKFRCELPGTIKQFDKPVNGYGKMAPLDTNSLKDFDEPDVLETKHGGGPLNISVFKTWGFSPEDVKTFTTSMANTDPKTSYIPPENPDSALINKDYKNWEKFIPLNVDKSLELPKKVNEIYVIKALFEIDSRLNKLLPSAIIGATTPQRYWLTTSIHPSGKIYFENNANTYEIFKPSNIFRQLKGLPPDNNSVYVKCIFEQINKYQSQIDSALLILDIKYNGTPKSDNYKEYIIQLITNYMKQAETYITSSNFIFVSRFIHYIVKMFYRNFLLTFVPMTLKDVEQIVSIEYPTECKILKSVATDINAKTEWMTYTTPLVNKCIVHFTYNGIPAKQRLADAAKYIDEIKTICTKNQSWFNKVKNEHPQISEFNSDDNPLFALQPDNPTYFELIPRLKLVANNLAVDMTFPTEPLRSDKKVKKLLQTDLATITDIIHEIDRYREYRFRHLYFTEICKNRLVEGEYINKTVADLRKTIQQMLVVKNQTQYDSGPRIIDQCIRDYCPTLANSCLFASDEEKQLSNTITTKDDISSEIVQLIFSEYSQPQETETTKQILDFYKSLQICILCVANISIEANNPPPVAYVDINTLKRMVTYHSDVLFGADDSEKTKELRDLFRSECLRVGCMIVNIYRKNPLFIEDDPYVKFRNQFLEPLARQTFEFGSLQATKQDLIKLLQTFFTLVDNSNATSTIGTLEFMDQSAKYNRTSTICNVDALGKAKAAADQNGEQMVPLYEGSIPI